MTLWTGSDGCTTSTSGIEEISVIPVKSLIGSKVCFCKLGMTAKASVVMRSVWPSGAALAAMLVPIALPPPGRLVTIAGWPHFSASRCAIMRAAVSVVPPATNGTTSSICRFG